MTVRCKRCGGVLMLPVGEVPDTDGLRLRDAIFGGVQDEELDWLHWDYRATKDKSVDEHIESGTMWALCNDCERTSQ